jgi:hypothetical protein
MITDWFFKNIETILTDDFDNFFETIIYLDVEQIYNLYSSITKLKGRPTVEIQKIKGGFKADLILGANISGAVSRTNEISDIYILKAILPKLKQYYAEINTVESLKNNVKKRVWIKGRLINSSQLKPGYEIIFKPEFHFDNFKVDLLIEKNYLSSLYNPMFSQNIEFEENAELFGHIHIFKEIDKTAKAIISPITIIRS